jgi:hypothetical protein
MPLRFAITKQSGSGEQIVVDLCQWNPVTGEIVHDTVAEMTAMADEALQVSDSRLAEMNMRVIEVAGLREYFTPEAWYKVVSILDIISGRQSAEQVKQTWDSITEENEALEQGRQAAYEAKQQLELYSNNHTTVDNITVAEQDILRQKCAEFGCVCHETYQHNCPVHCDNGRGA